MYRYGRKQHNRRRIAVFIFFFLVVSIGYGGYLFFQEDTRDQIVNSSATESKVDDNRAAVVTFNQLDFTIATPSGWVLYQKSETSANKVYYLKSAEKNTARTLVVYVDSDTKSYAVNRTIPLSSAADKFSVGQVSDTCSNFVGNGNNKTAQQDQKLADTLAKWQNITFLCDLSHANRNAIGISSTDGLNTVDMTGKSGVKHSYFFIYTDHSNAADSAIFTEMLRSFKAK